MKHILTLIFVTAITVTTTAQSIDTDRMHRDLEVAENALSTVITSESDELARWPSIHGNNIEAGFVKDYGVVFNVANKTLKYVLQSKAKKQKKKEKEKAKGKKEMKKDKSSGAKGLATSEEDDYKNKFIEDSKTFLADYAGIIGQLEDNHKISIRMGGAGSAYSNMYTQDFYVLGSNYTDAKAVWGPSINSSASSELIIEASVGDITALRKGKISRDDFFKKVKVVENEMSHDKDADMETLVAMFHRLYKKDLSDTYYSEHKPKYSKLSNFGVIVKMKFYSSYEDDNVYSMPTINKEGLSLVERNQHVMELLPKFESDFRENLVNYGRTMKNLDSNEILMFEINMTTCKDCKDFPRFMKFSVKKSVLQKYNQGELSMKQAADMVSVEKIKK